MFSSIFFLILVLLTLNLAPAGIPPLGLWESLGAIALAFGGVVMLIRLQRRLPQRTRTAFAQGELLALMLFIHFGLKVQSFGIPFFWLLGSLALYLVGFSLAFGKNQARFLLPFCIPFLLFDLLGMVLGDVGTLGALGITLGFLAVTATLFPYVIQKLWGCKPLPEGELKGRLDALCKRIKFGHGGMMLWPVMRHATTAAIIGIIRPFRYVMFTEALIDELSIDEIEAVLAHEIGHSRHRHLWFYPLIILGLVVVMSLFSLFVGDPLQLLLALKHRLYPAGSWEIIQQALLWASYAAIVVIYFRFLFGLFSRLFERQADLSVIDSSIPAKAMISALDRIAVVNGNIHKQPSWHHGSIQQRIDFLDKASRCPDTICRHHRKVRRAMRTYFALLVVGLLAVISPSIEAIAPVGDKMMVGGNWVAEKITLSTRHKLASDMIASVEPEGNQQLIAHTLSQVFFIYGRTNVPGVISYATASKLFDESQFEASASFLTVAWHYYPFDLAPPGARVAFNQLTESVLHHLPAGSALSTPLIEAQHV